MSILTVGLSNIVLWLMVIVATLIGDLKASPIIFGMLFIAIAFNVAGLFYRD
jgi:hypothetical protein